MAAAVPGEDSVVRYQVVFVFNFADYAVAESLGDGHLGRPERRSRTGSLATWVVSEPACRKWALFLRVGTVERWGENEG